MNQPFKPDRDSAARRVTYEVTLGENGRMNLPADLRQRLDIKGPGRIFIEIDEQGVPTITTLERRLKRIQSLMRPLIRPGESVVDELITERRAEAAREDRQASEWRRTNG